MYIRIFLVDELSEKPTMNLLMHLENPAEDSRQYGVASTSSANPVDLSPQFIDLDPPTSIEDFDKADSRCVLSSTFLIFSQLAFSDVL